MGEVGGDLPEQSAYGVGGRQRGGRGGPGVDARRASEHATRSGRRGRKPEKLPLRQRLRAADGGLRERHAGGQPHESGAAAGQRADRRQACCAAAASPGTPKLFERPFAICWKDENRGATVTCGTTTYKIRLSSRNLLSV